MVEEPLLSLKQFISFGVGEAVADFGQAVSRSARSA